MKTLSAITQLSILLLYLTFHSLLIGSRTLNVPFCLYLFSIEFSFVTTLVSYLLQFAKGALPSYYSPPSTHTDFFWQCLCRFGSFPFAAVGSISFGFLPWNK
jgi:hypothetical protein